MEQKPFVKIVQAAIKIWIGHRHHNIFRLILNETGRKASEIANELGVQIEQGFLTDTGEFFDRVESGKIAIESGQIEALKFPPNLYSVDLY